MSKETVSAQPVPLKPALANERREEQRAYLRSILDALREVDDPQIKSELRELVGASALTQQRKRRGPRNDDVRATVHTLGAAVRAPGWRPVPPQPVVDAGPRAVERWLTQWEDGYQAGELGGWDNNELGSLTDEMGLLK